MKAQIFLGVDGGGTGCRARIETENGEVLGRGHSGPATLRLGAEGAMNSVMHAANFAIEEAGLDSKQIGKIIAGVALAGAGRKGAGQQIEMLPHPFASLHCTNDGHGACLGAHSGQNGAIVIAGTGSVGLGFIDDRQLRVGGYGFPVSDEGSGAYLGLRAIQLSLRAHDGRRASTALCTEVLQRFQNDPYEIVAWMDKATASDYATFAPMVVRHADQGDSTARQIVQAAAEQIATFVRALSSQGAQYISLLGGLSTALMPWLAPDVTRLVKPADGDAISGAIIYARQKHKS